ncbi:hypothetical protein LZ32DRAFT_611750 [Colletotrichum eremochloae]|nr:hypothetical protein LZ32DRAFT_611750 [Colletotrichum eremochloae]
MTQMGLSLPYRYVAPLGRLGLYCTTTLFLLHPMYTLLNYYSCIHFSVPVDEPVDCG